jgi:hypothetical protein
MLSQSVRWRRARLLAPFVLVAGLALGLAATESAGQSTTPGVSSFFRVGGRVAHPRIYRLADLKALPAHTVHVSFQGPGGTQSHSFSGALLSDVESAAAPRFDADRKNDFLRWTARVHATDNGVPLTDTGFARLVVPSDKKGGRYVSIRQPDRLQFAPGWTGVPVWLVWRRLTDSRIRHPTDRGRPCWTARHPQPPRMQRAHPAVGNDG